MNTITITSRNVYGTETFYPACHAAQLFADVAGTKTLTPTVLRLIEKAGYEVRILDHGPVYRKDRPGRGPRSVLSSGTFDD
jgi:hypothetical protein